MRAPSAALIALLLTFFVQPSALAEKPEVASGNKHDNKHEKKHGEKHGGKDERRNDERDSSASISVGGIDIRIGGRERELFEDYYHTQARAGHCPPGLAKKNNGCLPPGQAKKWSRGKTLPAGIEIYDLPNDLRVRLPSAPAGHRYVRVAADILLIAVGTNMVVDALEDLMR